VPLILKVRILFLYESKTHNRPFRGVQEFFDSQIVLSAANLENLEIWKMVMNFLGTLCKAAGQKLFQRFFGFMKITSGKEKSPGMEAVSL
jgi:hypothetical protein